jgi:serine/threonine protein phosphatase PrpC
MADKIWDDSIQNRVQKWLARNCPRKGLVHPDGNGIVLSTTIGSVRQENEDRALLVRASFLEPGRAFIAAILCDGMGGMIEGGMCADLAVSSFVASLFGSKERSLAQRLVDAANRANQVVFKKYLGRGGATLSALIFDRYDLASVNIGDSRIYQVAIGGKVEQLSKDDTLRGQLPPVKDQSYPDMPEHRQLLQYVGMGEGIEPHIISLAPRSNFKYVVLSSDGAHNIPKETFESIIANAKTAKQAAERIIYVSEWCGGADNASIIIVSPESSLVPSRNEATNLNLLEIWDSFEKVEMWGLPSNIGREPELQKPLIPTRYPQKRKSKRQPSGQKNVKQPETPLTDDKTTPETEKEDAKGEQLPLRIEFRETQ